ncbi:MAG: hypothetical protein E7015_02630 [Alphaproteobacteria bacterium]|nr:hypothetical protein [Alphaproteobacteria bacterium]
MKKIVSSLIFALGTASVFEIGAMNAPAEEIASDVFVSRQNVERLIEATQKKAKNTMTDEHERDLRFYRGLLEYPGFSGIMITQERADELLLKLSTKKSIAEAMKVGLAKVLISDYQSRILKSVFEIKSVNRLVSRNEIEFEFLNFYFNKIKATKWENLAPIIDELNNFLSCMSSADKFAQFPSFVEFYKSQQSKRELLSIPEVAGMIHSGTYMYKTGTWFDMQNEIRNLIDRVSETKNLSAGLL